MNLLQLYHKRTISHVLWFQEGRGEEVEFQGGNSVRWGKAWYGGLKSLWGSNTLQHRALPGHLDQSGYSKIQPHRAGGRQNPRDSRSLKNSHKKDNWNKSTSARPNVQSGGLLFLYTGFSQTLNFLFPHLYFRLFLFTVNPPVSFFMFQGAVITLLREFEPVPCWSDISFYFSAAVLCASPPTHLQFLKREVKLQHLGFWVFK